MNYIELDKWIAENVMGWKMHPHREDHWIRPDSNRIDEFYPTTDSASAMEVLEKCAEKFPIEIRIGNYDEGRYFVGTDYDFDMTRGKAETLELAICLFAKKLLAKVKEIEI